VTGLNELLYRHDSTWRHSQRCVFEVLSCIVFGCHLRAKNRSTAILITTNLLNERLLFESNCRAGFAVSVVTQMPKRSRCHIFDGHPHRSV